MIIMGRAVTKIFGKSFVFSLSGELENKVELLRFKYLFYFLGGKAISSPGIRTFNYYVFYQLLALGALLVFFI